MTLTDTFKSVRRAAGTLADMTDDERNAVLADVADAIVAGKERLLAANGADLARMDKANPLYDRLRLTAERLDAIAADMRNVALLPSPLGRTSHDRTLPNGLHIRRVSVPFGVIGIVYEARPNVTFDVFALCFKSGSACILKGGEGCRQLKPRRRGTDTRGTATPRGRHGRRAAAALDPRSHRRDARGHRLHRPVHTPRRAQAD